MKVKTLLHMCRTGVKIRRLFGIGLIKIYLIDSIVPVLEKYDITPPYWRGNFGP